MGACYRQSDQEEDRLPVPQRMEDLLSQALTLMEDFNHTSICWRINTAEHKQSRRVLVCIPVNFLMQAVKKSSRESAMLHFTATNRKDLVWDIKARDSFSCSDYGVDPGRKKPGKMQNHNPCFRRADLLRREGLF